MKTRQQYHRTVLRTLTIFFGLTVVLTLTTCRKDISLPDPSLEKLFGTWEWVSTYCGWSGQSTPSSTGYTQTIEFNKNGIYKSFKDGKQQDKRKFTVTTGTSIHTSGTAYLINYKSIGLFKKKDYTTQWVHFSGDTLFLDAEEYDGCSSSYIKK